MTIAVHDFFIFLMQNAKMKGVKSEQFVLLIHNIYKETA